MIIHKACTDAVSEALSLLCINFFAWIFRYNTVYVLALSLVDVSMIYVTTNWIARTNQNQGIQYGNGFDMISSIP